MSEAAAKPLPPPSALSIGDGYDVFLAGTLSNCSASAECAGAASGRAGQAARRSLPARPRRSLSTRPADHDRAYYGRGRLRTRVHGGAIDVVGMRMRFPERWLRSDCGTVGANGRAPIFVKGTNLWRDKEERPTDPGVGETLPRLLITGGASILWAACVELGVTQGWPVDLFDVEVPGLPNGGSPASTPLDLADPTLPEARIESRVAEPVPYEGANFAAGIQLLEGRLQRDDALCQRTLAVNLTEPAHLIVGLAPLWRDGAPIVLFGSIAAEDDRSSRPLMP